MSSPIIPEGAYSYEFLEEVESEVSGKIQVLFNPVWGITIRTGKTTQSGGDLTKTFKEPLLWVKNRELNAKTCLILGFGSGTVAQLIENLWEGIKITGVEIDPLMLSLGEKYFNLDKKRYEIKIMDADKYLKKVLGKQKFDIIIADIYVGDNVPEIFDSEKFFRKLSKIINKNGFVLVNRLFRGNYIIKAKFTTGEIKKVFKKIVPLFSRKNVLLACSF